MMTAASEDQKRAGAVRHLAPLWYGLALLALLGTVFVHLTGPAQDPDFYWHLATGRWIVEHRALPESDPFTFAPASADPRPDEVGRVRFILRSYWLAQSLFFLNYQRYGWAGLVVMKAAVLTLAIGAMGWWMRRQRVPPLLALPALLLAGWFLGNAPFKSIRPQMFTMVCAVLLVALLEGVGRDPARRRWRAADLLLPLLMAVWSNLHGGVVLGNAIIALYLLAEGVACLRRRPEQRPEGVAAYRRLVVIGGAALAASGLNPEGYHSLSYVLNLGTTSRYGEIITEYMSPITMATQYHHPLFPFWIVLALGAAVHAWRLRHIPLRRHLLFLALAAVSLATYRYTVFLVLIEPLFIAAALRDPAAALAGRLPGMLRAGIVAPVGCLLLCGVLVYGDVAQGRVLKFAGGGSLEHPTGAAGFIRANGLHGNAFNTYDWGGFLIWELYPQVKVLYDGRGLVERLFWDSFKVWGASTTEVGGRPEWQALLSEWGADMAVIRGADHFARELHPLLPALVDDPDWALVYRGFDALLFLRRAAFADFAARHEVAGYLAYDQVIAQAGLAIDLRPYRKEPWLLMAQAQLYRGNRGEALRYYRKGLALDPSDGRARQMAALIEQALRAQ